MKRATHRRRCQYDELEIFRGSTFYYNPEHPRQKKRLKRKFWKRERRRAIDINT